MRRFGTGGGRRAGRTRAQLPCPGTCPLGWRMRCRVLGLGVGRRSPTSGTAAAPVGFVPVAIVGRLLRASGRVRAERLARGGSRRPLQIPLFTPALVPHRLLSAATARANRPTAGRAEFHGINLKRCKRFSGSGPLSRVVFLTERGILDPRPWRIMGARAAVPGRAPGRAKRPENPAPRGPSVRGRQPAVDRCFFFRHLGQSLASNYSSTHTRRRAHTYTHTHTHAR